MVSIIVPVYNTERYLDRCIQSILGQSYTDFELLLIDDGSVDSSGKICDKYALQDSRVKVFHKANGGVSSARNLGLANANGDWVIFCDSDDWVDSLYVEDLSQNDKADFVANHFIEGGRISLGNSESPFEDRFYEGTELKACIEKYLYEMLNPVCKRFKLSIINENNMKFNEYIDFGEDTIFVFSYLCHVKTIATTSGRHYYYNYTQGSLSQVHYSWEKYKTFLNEMIITVEGIGNVYSYEINSVLNRILGNFINKFICDCSCDYKLFDLKNALKEMAEEDVVRNQLKDRSYAKSKKRLLLDFLLLNRAFFMCALCLKVQRKLI